MGILVLPSGTAAATNSSAAIGAVFSCERARRAAAGVQLRPAVDLSRLALAGWHGVEPAGPRHPTAEHAGKVAGARRALQFLQREAHFALPIGILPGGSGQVLLFQFLGQVFLPEFDRNIR